MAADPVTLRAELVGELREALVSGLLECWYPRAVDEEFGGFYSELSLDFRPGPDQRKPLVVQARHLWATSRASQFLPGDPRYPRIARHAFRYLRDVMWDREHGGFLPRVYSRSRDGVWPASNAERVRSGLRRLVPSSAVRRRIASTYRRRAAPAQPLVKDVYDEAFAIFGLAAYHQASGDPAALDLARASFGWLEEHSHDPDHGGYLRYLSRAGSPLPAGPLGDAPKDLDSTLHLLEAFTELYRAWPDERVRLRLGELVELIGDRMISERGSCRIRFEPDWTPLRLTEADRQAGNFARDHVSFGHDIETAALLVDAAEALGRANDPTIHAIAKRLADHSLDHGWDAARGGMFEAGYYFSEGGPCEVVDRSKLYWVQAETLNTLSLLACRYPDDPRGYLHRFLEQWRYCDRYLVDHDRGGWYWQGLDALPGPQQPGKADPVRATYHVSRALMNSIGRLEAAEEPG
jgi:mannobiose 2-epimerase